MCTPLEEVDVRGKPCGRTGDGCHFIEAIGLMNANGVDPVRCRCVVVGYPLHNDATTLC